MSSASVSGTALTLTFDEALGAAASLANGSFTVKRTPAAGSEQTVSLSGTPSINGATVTLTLSAAVTATDTGVKVSYAVPTTGSANRLVDAAGNTAAAFTDTTVTNATGPALTVPGGELVGGDGLDLRHRRRDFAQGDVQRGGDGGHGRRARRASRSPWARRRSTRRTTRAAPRRSWCSTTR